MSIKNKAIEITVDIPKEDSLPTTIKVVFKEPVWRVAFKGIGHYRESYIPESEAKKLEAREAIRSFVYLMEKELRDALPEEYKY